MAKSELEETLAFQLQAAGVPFEREVRFHPTRRWRADFVVDGRVLVEVEGGVYSGGRHTRGSGFVGDCEKLNEAALLGYQVLRVTRTHIESGEALTWVLRATGRE